MFQKNTVILILCMLTVAFSTCPRNCTTCSTPTTCSACRAGNFVVNGSSCAPCPIGCVACAPGEDGRPVCSECAAPGHLGGDGRCFLCDPSCADCDVNPRNCTSCPPGKELVLTDDHGACGAIPDCPIQRCAQCTQDPYNSTVCGQCLPGFFPYRQFCFPCKFPCAACQFNLDAVWAQITPLLTEVVSGALAIAGISDLTPFPFLNNLNFSGMPIEMRGGWLQAFLVVKVAEGSGVNLVTLVPNIPSYLQFINSIQSLTPRNQELAIVRKINQVLSKNWTIQQLYNKTGQVAAGFTMCAECLNGFQPDENLTNCVRCSLGCVECSGAVCTVCKEGFFLDGTSCTRCTAPCSQCENSATECTACNPPYSLTGSACIQCEEPCATCDAGNSSSCLTCRMPFSLTAEAGTCFRCDQGLCVECQSSNTSICLQCKVGAILVDGRCERCPANCSSCSGGTPDAPPVCFECLPGYQMTEINNQSRCLPCGPGCARCSSDTCLECRPGTFLNRDGRCQRCNQGCKECDSFDVCTLTDAGVIIIDGNVMACIRGCKTCEGAPNICTQCQQRYFTDNGKCRPCEPGCKVCDDETTCTECLDNLHLSGGNCERCEGNCKTCDSGNVSSCTSCKRGFTLIGDDCVNNQCNRGCLECSPSNASICITCAVGNVLREDGKCVRCLGSCSGSCDPRNISICLSCADGLELRDNKCSRCPMGCTKCSNGDCTECVPGYQISERTNGSFICTEKCRPPCLTCSGQTCKSCENGFKLSNNKCTPDLSCNPSCTFCPVTTERSDNGTCIRCPQGCANCASGVCLECLDGSYLNFTSLACVRCPANCTTCYNAESCIFCARGYVKQILSMGTGVDDAVYSDRCIRCDSSCATCVVEPTRCTSCPTGTRLLGSACIGMYTVSSRMEIDIVYATFLENSQAEQLSEAIARKCGVRSSSVIINSVTQGSTVVDSTISASNQAQAQSAQQSLGSGVPGYTTLGSSAVVFYGDSQYVPEEEKKAGPNVGLIVGVVVGSVVLVTVVSFLIYKFKCKKNNLSTIEDESAIVAKQEN